MHYYESVFKILIYLNKKQPSCLKCKNILSPFFVLLTNKC